MTDRPNSFPGGAEDREDSGGLLPALSPPGKAKRKAIPANVQVQVAIRQAWQSANAGCEYFACGICKKPLNAYEPRILEHMVPRATRVALGLDPDCPSILAWVHKECAAKKTNGNKATCADGDLHKIAKAKRLARAQEVHRAVLAGEHKRERSRMSHPTLKRTFSGKVVSRG